MSRLSANLCVRVVRFWSVLAALFCVAILSFPVCAQEAVPVPPLVKFSGTITGAPAGTAGVIFALYKDSSGGAPLWQEVQNVTVDAAGRYTAFLGSRSAKGIPVEVFNNGEAHWLSVQAQGQAEQPRVLLVSVPYALKANDAETLGGLPASAFLRADSAIAQSAAAQPTYINANAVNNAAGRIATAAIVASGATTGYVPVFSDAAGDLTNSSFFQAANGYIGIGTTTPAFNLNVISQSDPAAVTVEGYGVVGVNFIGRRARGSFAAPSALLANDNIMAMQGRGFGATAFSPGSRAYMKFFAAENWSDTAQGTYISLATTLKGTAPTSTPAPERMRITDAGFVGIGTTAPAAMLEVNGTAQFDGAVSFASGQAFPGVVTSVGAADGSITVAGTASAPTVALNTSFTNALYAPASGSAVYAPATGSTNYVAKSGDTMTGGLTLPAIAGAAGSALNITSNSTQAINLTTPNLGSGSGNGGVINITAGQAGYGTGGSGGDVNVTAGFNVPLGGAGYANLGPPGNVNITAGGGYNSAGGNAIVSGGSTSSWGYGNTFSKASLHGGTGNTGDAAVVDVEGGHTLAYPSTNGGNILLTAGSAVGGSTGGNIVLTPGSGSTGGSVQAKGNFSVTGTTQFGGLVTFASGQTFPGAGGSGSVSITSPNNSITVGGSGSAPTLVLSTSYLNGLYAPAAGSTNYVAIGGSTMTGALTLPANGLQMAGNQIATSGGHLGFGAAPSVESMVEIGGSVTEPAPTSYGAELLRLDGTVSSSAYGQAYLKGIVVAPTFNISGGYANYMNGIELSMASVVGSSGVHSVVGYLLDSQPTNGIECSVGFGIGVPNQNKSLCNGSYGFYQAAGANYNYFASNVGIGTPFPSQALTVQGNVQVNGNINAFGTIQSNGVAGAVVTQGTPASSTAACTPPQMMYDASYLYTCVAANTWQRAATSAF